MPDLIWIPKYLMSLTYFKALPDRIKNAQLLAKTFTNSNCHWFINIKLHVILNCKGSYILNMPCVVLRCKKIHAVKKSLLKIYFKLGMPSIRFRNTNRLKTTLKIKNNMVLYLCDYFFLSAFYFWHFLRHRHARPSGS